MVGKKISVRKNVWSKKKFGTLYLLVSRSLSLLHLPSKVFFHRRSSLIKGRLPSKVIFHQRSSSIKVLLPSKVVSHQRSSPIKGRLPSKVIFQQRSSSIKGPLPSKVIFHQRSSSIKFHLPLHPKWCSSINIVSDHFILPCLFDCWCQLSS